MKRLLFFFLCFITLKSSAQNISGLYSGTLINDSLKMVQNYELALSEYRGKITGYSYITFVSNDTFYYGIKRIKATRKNGELVVEDVEMLANNYPKRPDKGVHVINRIPLPAGQDTILDMNGRWETTGTKRFYSISGALNLRRDNDSAQSPLISHLKELQVINYQDDKKGPRNIAQTEVKEKPKDQKETKVEPKTVALNETKSKISTSNEIIPETKSATSSIAKVTSSKTNMEETKPKETVVEKEATLVASTRVEPNNTQAKTSVLETQPKEIIAQENKPKQVASTETKFAQPGITVESNSIQNKPAITQPTAAQSKPSTVASASQSQKQVAVSAENTKPKEIAPGEIKPVTNTVATNSGQVKNTEPGTAQAIVSTEVKTSAATPETKTVALPAPVANRATNTIQTLNVVSDSLTLTFYDNGVVDGDSISVYINDQNIISKVKLTEAAVKKTVYTNVPNSGELRLTLVAENLGSIPPNTGLLIIQDGSQRYQIRFSADMQTNASVIIKKNK